MEAWWKVKEGSTGNELALLDAYKSSIVNGEKFKEKIEAYGDAFEEVLKADTHNPKALIEEKVLVDGDQFMN